MIYLHFNKVLICVYNNAMQVQCGGPSYQVQLGRRDGMVSQASMASILPGPNVDVPTAIDLFGRKGINALEMVSLMGTSSPPIYATMLHFYFSAENDIKS